MLKKHSMQKKHSKYKVCKINIPKYNKIKHK